MRIGIDLRMCKWMEKSFGLSYSTKELIDHLFKIDQENEYVLFFDKNFNKEEYESFIPLRKGIEKRIVNAKYYSLREQLFFPFALLKEKLDLVYFPNFNIPILYPKTSIVVINDLIHLSPWIKTSFWLKKAYQLIIFLATKKAKTIIAISETTKKEIIKYFKTNPRKIKIIYLAASNVFYKKENPEKIFQIKKKYQIEKPFIFFISAWKKHKNIENLVSAFEILREKYLLDFQLALAGKEDSKYPEIKEKILKSKWKNEIKILGTIPDDEELSYFYSLTDLLIIPSFVEGFGLSGLQAIQCGAPVAVSKISCLPEIYGDAVEYFDPYNPENMAEVMAKILKNKDLQKKMIEKGFKKVKEFSWENCARETLEVFESVTSNQ